MLEVRMHKNVVLMALDVHMVKDIEKYLDTIYYMPVNTSQLIKVSARPYITVYNLNQLNL
tara:strand:+ start:216 stop:395 length:180 start_codon:yes stop_codon:yes gene_type:complete